MPANEQVSENHVAIREFLTPDGDTRVEVTIEGDHEFTDAEEPASLSYIVAAALFQLYSEGEALKVMHERFGFTPGQVEIKLETT